MVRALVLAAWLIIGVAIIRRWRRRPAGARLGPLLARLAGACALAMLLTAAQLLPILEFAARSGRVVGENATDFYRLSTEPYRLVELAWPNVFGQPCPENRSWLQAIPPVGDRQVWAASLYMGGLALVLALGAAGWRGAPPWRAWMTAIAVVALAASLGKFAGPLWWARWPRPPPRSGRTTPASGCRATMAPSPTGRAAPMDCSRRCCPASACSATPASS